MKKTILLCLIFVSLVARAQVSPTLQCRVANLVTAFGQNLPVGSEVYVISDSTKWTAKAYVASTATITTALSSFFPTVIRVRGTLPVTVSGTNGKVLIGTNDVTTIANGLMTAADKVKLNSITVANIGTVKSVGLTAPTGLTVSSSPVTTTGTIGLAFTSGYSIPTTANQAIWTAKQAALNGGTGLVYSAAGMISYDTNTYLTGTPWTSYGYWKAGAGNHPTTTAGYDLPAYPTTLPASDVFPWAKASTPVTQYTDAMARLSNSFTAGSGAYNNSTGVITIPTNTNQLTNGAGFITGTVSHAHGNISYTGAIGTTTGLPIITTTSGVLTAGSFGTTAGTFAQGNDSRLSDARVSNIAAGTSGYVMTSNGSVWTSAAPSGSGPNITVQSLSGTSVSWNCTNGINAILTLSGTTTITLSNVTAGTSGNIKVTNPSGAANILNFALSGKTVLISPAVYVSSGWVLTSGSSKIDMFSWYYDGTNLIINGSNNYL